MPVKEGVEALKEIVEFDPDAVVVMASSVASRQAVEKSLNYDAFYYLRKHTPILIGSGSSVQKSGLLFFCRQCTTLVSEETVPVLGDPIVDPIPPASRQTACRVGEPSPVASYVDHSVESGIRL